MSRAQIGAVSLCLVMNLIDGFDLLMISFVGPTIAKAWHLAPSQLGLLFSAGPAGMAFGALFLAPLADRIGRRRLTLIFLAVASLGMLGASVSQGFGQLLAARAVTGVAIGVMAASLPVLASEYANNKRRGMAVALITTGYGLGAIIAGIATSQLVGPYGWRSVFVFGGVATAIIFAIGLRYLPESIDYLVARRPDNALARLNRILVSMGRAQVDELPEKAPAPRKVALESLFRGNNAVRTVLVWVAFVAAQTTYYFTSSWTPSLLLKAGMSTQQGLSGGVLFAIGGVLGAVLLGVLASRFEARRLTAAYFVAGALALVLFSVSLGSLGSALVVAVLVGLLATGTVSGINVIVPALYPTEARATALGIAGAVSRVGAILAPLFAGFLVQAGWGPGSMYRIFALAPLVGALATILLVRGMSARGARGSSPAAAEVAEGTATQA
ncbi:MFS transporter [Amycolatopsis sp. GM8]|uniref:MFS transporter n=1 Tax=Amycolatopsis sp. GM8 TaxID=2896530 RepID=UPI001F011389|nr:MFS transporter [Amycolatopsis sp. GM8]